MRRTLTFRPQAWVRDNAIDVDPQGPTTWIDEVPDGIESHSYESDELRLSEHAPQWVRDWSGPFEVEIGKVSA